MIETIGFILTGLGLTASIVYYANTLQNANKTRQTQVLQRSLEHLSNRDTNLDWWTVFELEWKDYDDLRAKYGPSSDMETWAMINTVWNEMNGIGYLVKRGVIDIESVYDFGGGRPSYMYRKYKPVFDEMRKRGNWNRFEAWDYLYGEMRRLSDERGDTFLGIKSREKSNQ